ncbi:MAG: polyhydroxyalkanoate synthesis repressor PhaR [Pseudomonadota bacterium]
MSEANGAGEPTQETTVIKKYANRRLYNTGTSTYVTLEDLSHMVKAGEDFVVFDAKSSDDITRSVLTQIIFEQEAKGENLLPISFLRQLIRFYGDSMQGLVPSYLTFSIESLARDQSKLRDMVGQALGGNAFDVMQDQVKRNQAMFEKSMRMFSPFSPPTGGDAADDHSKENGRGDDIDKVKEKLADMERRLEALSKPET